MYKRDHNSHTFCSRIGEVLTCSFVPIFDCENNQFYGRNVRDNASLILLSNIFQLPFLQLLS